MLKHASNRDVYQTAVEYLRRMKQLGKATRVKKIVEQLKTQYPKRHALFEELAKV